MMEKRMRQSRWAIGRISPGRLCALLVLAVGLAAISGCGDGRPKRARVTGVVIYHGKPVDGAGVTFYCSGGALSRGTTDANGRFSLMTFSTSGTGESDGAIVGEHTVSINKYIPDPNDPRPEGFKAKISVLPARYASMLDSPLRRTVTAEGPNDFRIELVD
jgi:hypothetical protein